MAAEILASVGRRLDLNDGYEDEAVETVGLLDASGLLGCNDLRQSFEEADDHAQSFVALLAAHLSHAADIERLGTNQCVQALRLAGAWQSHLLDRARTQSDPLTAPQVAARYGVTPQAVYKWIKAGRVRAKQTPGGSWRLPADQFGDRR